MSDRRKLWNLLYFPVVLPLAASASQAGPQPSRPGPLRLGQGAKHTHEQEGARRVLVEQVAPDLGQPAGVLLAAGDAGWGCAE